ncbi:MAG: DUF945 family protein [Pseudohongiellaceae bacterium]
MASKARIALIAVASLTLAGLVFAPKIIGLGIRDITINSLVALIPPESQDQIAFDEKQFDSGWFGTTATLKASYIPFGTEFIAMDFDFNIQHGPLLFTDDGPRLGITYAKITPKSEAGIPLFDQAKDNLALPNTLVELFAGFDQSLSASLTVDPISYEENGSTLEFSGVSANLAARADQSAEIVIKMGSLAIEESMNNQSLLVTGMEIYTQSSQLNDVLAPSAALFEVSTIKTSGPLSLELSDLSFSSTLKSSTNPDAIMMSQHISAPIIAGDLPLESFEWTLEIDELQRRLMADYSQLIANLQSQAASDPQAAAQNINLVSQQLTQLLINNPLAINNTLDAHIYGGSHRADLELSWEGLPQLNNIARLDLNEGLAALNFSVDISLDAQALSTSPIADQVNAYAQQGFIVSDQDRMLITATLQNSKLVLNGEEILLENFF